MAMQGRCWSMPVSQGRFNQGQNFLKNERKIFGDTNRGQYFTLFGSAGFSIYADNSSSEVTYGAPGNFDWSGSFLTVSGDDGTVSAANPKFWENPEIGRSDYTGYTVIKGDFDGPKYIVGAPRGGHLRSGQVLIMTMEGKMGSHMHSSTIHQSIKGAQTGEYFGASLVTGDFNGDGQMDLIVGSPLYTFHKIRVKRDVNYNNNFVKKFEEGKISVFTFESGGLVLQQTVSPAARQILSSGSRFGVAMVNIGDITGDGVDDLAVGAPGADAGRGHLYIYRGSAQNGLQPKEIQIIKATDFSFVLTGFGLSLSGGLDLDDNGLQDLVVGAPGSDSAILLRTNPSIEYSASLKFEPTTLTLLTMNDFSLEVCIAVNKRSGSVHYTSDILTNLTLITDKSIRFKDGSVDKIYQRRLLSTSNLCQTFEMEMSSQYVSGRKSNVFLYLHQLPEISTKYCKECGIIDPSSSTEFTEQIEFQKNCRNPKCESDLSTSAEVLESGDDGFVIGGTEKLTLVVKVANLEGEPAYRPRLNIQYPGSLKLTRDISGCVQTELDDHNRLFCNLPSPLVGNNQLRFDVELDGGLLFAGIPKLEFNINVESESTEINPRNNKFTLVEQLISIVDVEMIGPVKEDERVLINNGIIKDLSFNQFYQVRNHKVSPLKGVVVEVFVPLGFSQNNRETIILENIEGKLEGSAQTLKCATEMLLKSSAVGDMSLNLDCGVPGTPCMKLRCGPFGLPTTSSVADISVSGRLSGDTITQMSMTMFSITSLATVMVPGLDPNILAANDIRKNNDTYTTVFSSLDTTSAGVPIWQIIISAVGGLIVLLIILIILVKIGFFRRKVSELKAEANVANEFELHNQQQTAENQPMISTSP